MSNNVKFCISSSIITFSLLFTSGGLLQTFFSELGFSLSQIGTYTSVVGVAQIIMMIVNIFFADRVKNILKLMTFLKLSPIISCTVFLAFSLFPKTPTGILFVTALFICTLQNVFMGFYNVLSYRIPYILFDMRHYATITNSISIISSVASIVVSLLITLLSRFFDYKTIMSVAFLLCIILSVIASDLIRKCKPIETAEPKSPPSQNNVFSKIFKKDYVFFYCPNFLRGLFMGVVGVISVIFIKNISKNPSQLSALVPVLSVATILGSILYERIKKFLSTEMIYFVSSIVIFALFPILVIGKSITLFFVVYAIIGIAYQMINQAAAVHPTEFIPYKEIGSFTSVRLIVMTAGSALSAYIVGLIVESVPSVFILLAAGLIQFASGLFYFCFGKKAKK